MLSVLSLFSGQNPGPQPSQKSQAKVAGQKPDGKTVPSQFTEEQSEQSGNVAVANKDKIFS